MENLRKNALSRGIDIKNEFYEIEDSKDLINQMSTLVYRNSSDNKKKIKTVLYQSYHHW